MNTCKKCGKPTGMGDQFCQSCGGAVSNKEKGIVSLHPKRTKDNFAFITNLFRGRINRMQFFIGGLLEIIVFLVIVFPTSALFLITGMTGEYTLAIIVIVAQAICYLFVGHLAVKRLHDMGFPSWLAIILLMPGINAMAFIVLSLWRGNDSVNKYGNPPPSGLSHLFKTIIGLA